MSGEFLLYQAPDGSSRIQVRLENRTLWLIQQQLADLYESTPQNITQLIQVIYAESESTEAATRKPYLQVRAEAGRQVSRRSSTTTWMWSSPLATECARTVARSSGDGRQRRSKRRQLTAPSRAGQDSRDGVTRIGGGVRAWVQLLRTHAHVVPLAQLLPEQAIVVTLSRQLSWSHLHALLPIKDPLARDFYAEMCRSERWDVRSSDMNKATIEPWKASAMTLNGLSMPGIGVSNEPR